MTNEMRMTLSQLLLSLEQMVARPRLATPSPLEVDRATTLALLALQQVREAIRLDEVTANTLPPIPTMWCPSDDFGERLRARRNQRSILAPAPRDLIGPNA